jgi:hypothetical protein
MVFGHIRAFGVEKAHERVSGFARCAVAATIPPVLPERQPPARRADSCLSGIPLPENPDCQNDRDPLIFRKLTTDLRLPTVRSF